MEIKELAYDDEDMKRLVAGSLETSKSFGQLATVRIHTKDSDRLREFTYPYIEGVWPPSLWYVRQIEKSG